MRLLEPFSGIKMMQGHSLVHLVFFIAIFFVRKGSNVGTGSVDPFKTHHCNDEWWWPDNGRNSHLVAFMHHSSGMISYGD